MPGKSHRQRYKQFIDLLVDVRKRAPLTQIEVAEALKETQTFVSKVERAERRLDVIDLIDFLNVYGKPAPEFVSELIDALAGKRKVVRTTSRVRKHRAK